MLGDTFTVPHADGDIVCVKINQDGYSSEYLKRDSGGLFETSVRVRHTVVTGKNGAPDRERHNVEFTQTVYATESEDEFQRKVYVVFEQLSSDGDWKLTDALADWLASGGIGANILKLVGWES